MEAEKIIFFIGHGISMIFGQTRVSSFDTDKGGWGNLLLKIETGGNGYICVFMKIIVLNIFLSVYVFDFTFIRCIESTINNYIQISQQVVYYLIILPYFYQMKVSFLVS